MSRASRVLRKPWAIGLAAAVVAGGVAVAAVVRHIPDAPVSPAISSRSPNLANGAYVARLGDCTACHTAPGKAFLAGGRGFGTPMGQVYSTNITSDREHGIGRYSFEDFVRLMRLGVRPDGGRVYPAMPYTAFSKLSDADLQDLYAYLMRGVPASDAADRPSGIIWPLSLRWPLVFWNMAFHADARPFAPDTRQSSAWNRGAYLVQGAAHCGTCHTPRGLALQEKDLDGHSDLYLSGARLAGDSPINLRGDLADGLGRWTAGDIVDLLSTGRTTHSAVVGSMTEVVEHSGQYMTPADLSAIATYVKSLSPASPTQRASFVASPATLDRIMAGRETSAGGRMFMDSCSACHRLGGGGARQTFPQLAGNATVLSRYPDSLIGVILKGARLPSTPSAPSANAMPPFGWRYSDQQVSELATYVRQAWGDGAQAVTAGQVKAVRGQLGVAEPRS
ncbi:MAG: cytochrome c [Caulobacteraceae bacterium]